jgi:dolichyl-phosphate-mannose--protein O-mannosyl transferase
MGDPNDKLTQHQARNPVSKLFRALLRPRPLGVLIAAMLVLGVWLRVHAFGYPEVFMFDEHHFVENARNYLNNKADWNDHPPLGKLIIAQSIELLGDSSVGWRIPSLIFGFLTIACGGLASSRLFRSAGAGWLAAAFLSVDGFLIAYSRAALLDGFLAAGLAITLLISTFAVNAWAAMAAGALLGFSASIKFSGIAVALPIVTAALFAKVPRRKLVTMGALFCVTAALCYLAQYSRGLTLALKSATPVDVVQDTQRLIEHHAGLTDMKNPWTSGWITWAIPTRPAMLSYARNLGEVRVLSGLGNLALWWPGVLVTIASIVTILARGVVSIASPIDETSASESSSVDTFVQAEGRAVLVLLAGCLGFIAPWVMSHRDSYIYHFLPAYVAIIMLLSGYVDWFRKRKPIDAMIFIGVVLVVAAFYAPIWSSMVTSEAAVNARLFWGAWR